MLAGDRVEVGRCPVAPLPGQIVEKGGEAFVAVGGRWRHSAIMRVATVEPSGLLSKQDRPQPPQGPQSSALTRPPPSIPARPRPPDFPTPRNAASGLLRGRRHPAPRPPLVAGVPIPAGPRPSPASFPDREAGRSIAPTTLPPTPAADCLLAIEAPPLGLAMEAVGVDEPILRQMPQPKMERHDRVSAGTRGAGGWLRAARPGRCRWHRRGEPEPGRAAVRRPGGAAVAVPGEQVVHGRGVAGVGAV